MKSTEKHNIKDLSQKIAAVIIKLRHKLNLSQEDLADKSNLHRTYISQIERGKKNITVLSLKKICQALNISLSDFFSLLGKEK